VGSAVARPRRVASHGIRAPDGSSQSTLDRRPVRRTGSFPCNRAREPIPAAPGPVTAFVFPVPVSAPSLWAMGRTRGMQHSAGTRRGSARMDSLRGGPWDRTGARRRRWVGAGQQGRSRARILVGQRRDSHGGFLCHRGRRTMGSTCVATVSGSSFALRRGLATPGWPRPCGLTIPAGR
jgi:hypothetical protein